MAFQFWDNHFRFWDMEQKNVSFNDRFVTAIRSVVYYLLKNSLGVR